MSSQTQEQSPFEQAFAYLESTVNNVFVTGKAGTGKSTLLEYFRDHSRKGSIVLAPTGVAAVHVKGQTIHSFFRFRPDITVDGVEELHVAKSRRKLYERMETIVIDEISMVRADLLDCIDAFLRLYGPVKGAAFGGVQMIFFGDLYQLPPVVLPNEREIFNSIYKSPYFFDAKSFAALNCQIVELNEVFRQKDDDFLELLNAIRHKRFNQEQLSALNRRLNPAFSPGINDFYIYLTTTNAMADEINARQLMQLETRECVFNGEESGTFDKKGLPTQSALRVKVGAQVMLLNNDNYKRWVNGTLGRIIGFDKDNGLEGHIRVELDNGRQVDVTANTWEMFRFVFNNDTESIESERVGAFRQFPLRLAWAVTIHKAQGKTFDRVILDVGRGAFAHGQIYVALSRCTTLGGLILKRPIRRSDIFLDNEIVTFMQSAQKRQIDLETCLVKQ